MLDALSTLDARTVVELLVTVASAVGVVVTLKADVRWLTRIFDIHTQQDDKNFAEIRRELDQLRSQIFNHK